MLRYKDKSHLLYQLKAFFESTHVYLWIKKHNDNDDSRQQRQIIVLLISENY